MLQLTSSTGTNDGHEPCWICGRMTRIFCYKIFVCSACTMFYRRNFRAFPRIRCRFIDERCNLKSGPRRFCMKCRLRACRMAGLRMWGKNLVVQVNGQPEEDTPEERMNNLSGLLFSGSDECNMSEERCREYGNAFDIAYEPSTSSGYESWGEAEVVGERDGDLKFLEESPINLPHLRDITTLFRRFDEQQKFLSSLQQKSELHDFTSSMLIYMDYVQFTELEPKILRCAVQLVTNFLLKLQVKDELILKRVKGLANHISWYHKILQSIRQFPQGIDFVSPYTGYYCNLVDLECHFADIDDDSKLREVVKTVAPFFKQFHSILNEGRELKIHPVEVAFLVGKVILETVGNVNFMVSSYHHHLHNEFSGYNKASGHNLGRLQKILGFGEKLKVKYLF
ncbi:unnamed protein product [Bursaphelenchus xylophilus]|uniref:(pine wood nematode) hypothetical protein n=1 Tax=Bursaphelenchus xylophilus TaxID=6326 RepID=A0A1I7RI11_BURXY|nr:unnamed protein product [Bursaphelenchus xylophilus]CAG9115236.1 unnamed protein product [Bursaphelenchus xylophilus]